MSQQPDDIAALILKQLQGELTDHERLSLESALNSRPELKNLYQSITEGNVLEQGLQQLLSVNTNEALTKLKQKTSMPATITPVHRVHFINRRWFRYAAAIVVIVVGISTYYYITRLDSRTKNELVQTTSPAITPDVLPGYNRAVLTLSTGQHVLLDSAGSKTIRDQSVSIENVQGKLTYATAHEVLKNTVSTPRGGQYQIRLSDGSRVWLNAESSITFPTVFNGSSREVTITGEAYFEVAKNPLKPFLVHAGNETIKVLGTHFNVNAYTNEPALKVSLLEGSVKVGRHVLRPGEAFLNGTVIATNTQQDIGWKNGFFSFDDAELKTVMRQLGRWYDVDVRYAGEVSGDGFSGDIGRSLTLAQVLNVLKVTGIRYTLENHTLTILSEK